MNEKLTWSRDTLTLTLFVCVCVCVCACVCVCVCLKGPNYFILGIVSGRRLVFPCPFLSRN